MRRRPKARQRRWASTRRRFTRRSTRQEMAGWIFPASSGTSAASPENDKRSMTTFQEARAFLLQHRSDYDAAGEGFPLPGPPPLQSALDSFDAQIAPNPQNKD